MARSLNRCLERFRPIALQLTDEESLLDSALAEIESLDPGAIAVLPEFVAWTPERSEIALASLIEAAEDYEVGIITSLNLPPGVMEDLPGRDESVRYNAVVVITRHGDLHVPQAKVTPQGCEQTEVLKGPGIGVAPYDRINRVRFDVGEEVITARLLVCSDLWAFTRFKPDALRSDLLVVPANFARGAEAHAARILTMAREEGVARATILVNAYHVPRRNEQEPMALAASEVEIAPRRKVGERWHHPKLLRDAFRTYPDERAITFADMVNLPERDGRIAVPDSLADAPLELGDYPITIVF